MKRSIKIENEPEKVKEVLSSLATDKHFVKTFEGTATRGMLAGLYTNLALINGLVIGYVKVKGHYDLTKGDLLIKVIPSKLYWLVINFNVVGITIFTYLGSSEHKEIYIGSLLFLFMAAGITIAFLLESRIFIKHIRRIIN